MRWTVVRARDLGRRPVLLSMGVGLVLSAPGATSAQLTASRFEPA